MFYARKFRRFSLVELLVVLGIMALLMTLGLPAFNELLQGDAAQRGARQLSTAMAQARSLAASQRRYVALLLPDNTQPWNAVLEDPYYGPAGRCYRLCFVTKDGENYVFDDWGSSSDWKELTGGALLTQIDRHYEGVGTLQDSQIHHGGDFISYQGLIEIDKPGAGDENSFNGRVGGLVFSPTGSLMNGEVFMVVAEGTAVEDPAYDRSLMQYKLVFRKRNETGLPNNTQGILINMFTGKAKMVDVQQ